MKLVRSLKQYRDVENFADFEMTNCIAYEFAIRVHEVIESIKNNNCDDYIFTTYGIGGEYWINYHFFSDIHDYIYEDDTKIYTDSGGTFFQPGEYKIQKRERTKEGDLEQWIRTDGMNIHTLLLNGNSFAEVHNISPIYKRPHMSSLFIERNIDFHINMNLPLEEIQAFIKHVYDYQKKNRNVLASPFELLGGKIQEADDIVKNSKKKGNALHKAGLILKTQNRIADALFVYDAYKLGWKNSAIKAELDHYYYDRNKTVDPTTINKYLDITKEYIDNLKYKELLTGVRT
jgi:hypothetical protein